MLYINVFITFYYKYNISCSRLYQLHKLNNMYKIIYNSLYLYAHGLYAYMWNCVQHKINKRMNADLTSGTVTSSPVV